jgi:hypothetical protein
MAMQCGPLLGGQRENRVRTLRDALADSGVKMDLSLDDNLKTLSWYDFASRYRLKQLREEMRAVARQFTMFVDDVTSVLICRGTASSAEAPFANALVEKRRLDLAISSSSNTVGQMVDVLIDAASRVSAELHAA